MEAKQLQIAVDLIKTMAKSRPTTDQHILAVRPRQQIMLHIAPQALANSCNLLVLCPNRLAHLNPHFSCQIPIFTWQLSIVD
jgi:hypothetical protein